MGGVREKEGRKERLCRVGRNYGQYVRRIGSLGEQWTMNEDGGCACEKRRRENKQIRRETVGRKSG